MKRSTILALVAAIACVASGRVASQRRSIPWAPPSGEIRDATLSVRIAGHGRPAVVLLHGMFRSGRYWSAHYDALPGTVIAPDLLGFGRSRAAAPADASDVTPGAHADAVAATLDDVGLPTPAVLVGHSTGALVAIHVARRHPRLVAGVVAINPPLYPDAETARRRLRGADPYTRLLLARPALSEEVCELMCRHRGAARALTRLANPTIPRPLNDDAVEHTWPSFDGTLEHLLLSDDHGRWVDDVAAPVRIIAGTEDALMEHAFLRRLAERPHVELDAVPGGHDVPLRDPRACVSRIEAALASFGRIS